MSFFCSVKYFVWAEKLLYFFRFCAFAWVYCMKNKPDSLMWTISLLPFPKSSLSLAAPAFTLWRTTQPKLHSQPAFISPEWNSATETGQNNADYTRFTQDSITKVILIRFIPQRSAVCRLVSLFWLYHVSWSACSVCLCSNISFITLCIENDPE